MFLMLKNKNLENYLDVPYDKFLLLLPGRLTYWKGQKLFIEAINLLNLKINLMIVLH